MIEEQHQDLEAGDNRFKHSLLDLFTIPPTAAKPSTVLKSGKISLPFSAFDEIPELVQAWSDIRQDVSEWTDRDKFVDITAEIVKFFLAECFQFRVKPLKQPAGNNSCSEELNISPASRLMRGLSRSLSAEKDDNDSGKKPASSTTVQDSEGAELEQSTANKPSVNGADSDCGEKDLQTVSLEKVSERLEASETTKDDLKECDNIKIDDAADSHDPPKQESDEIDSGVKRSISSSSSDKSGGSPSRKETGPKTRNRKRSKTDNNTAEASKVGNEVSRRRSPTFSCQIFLPIWYSRKKSVAALNSLEAKEFVDLVHKLSGGRLVLEEVPKQRIVPALSRLGDADRESILTEYVIGEVFKKAGNTSEGEPEVELMVSSRGNLFSCYLIFTGSFSPPLFTPGEIQMGQLRQQTRRQL